MRNKLLSICVVLIGLVGYSQTTVNKVRGTVTDGQKALSNANISIKNTDLGILTDKDGKYEIQVSPGQELVFQYIGFETVEVIVEDVTTRLNIQLYPKIEQLKEVDVVEEKRFPKTQKELFENFNKNKGIFKSAFGLINARTYGFASRFIQGDELSLGAPTFLQALASSLPGSLIRDDDIILTRSRRGSSEGIPAIFDVDGVITNQVPAWLDPSQVDRIVVLQSLGGIVRYGNIAAGGVIVVNTKLANFSPDGTTEVQDQARLRDNFFEEGSTISVYNAGIPDYLKALRTSDSKQEALVLFTKQRATYGSYADHLLDSFNYFSKTWNDADICADIAEIIETDFSENPVALKSLAYMFEERKDYETAESLYKKVFILRPNYSQSYMDLANVYRSTGRTGNAASIYARFDYLVDEDLFNPSDNFTPVLTRDFHNLVVLNSDKLKRKDRKKLDLDEAEFKGTRLVFEWSDSEAEFELQFVNPEKQYHTWKHTYIDNPDRIKDEKKHGYSSEEYLIYGPFDGTWTVNVNYMGNKKLSSTYLKATVYHNYGTKQQRKEAKVFKLRLKDVNQKLFSVDDMVLYAAN